MQVHGIWKSNSPSAYWITSIWVPNTLIYVIVLYGNGTWYMVPDRMVLWSTLEFASFCCDNDTPIWRPWFSSNEPSFYERRTWSSGQEAGYNSRGSMARTGRDDHTGNENNFVGDIGAEHEFGRGCEAWWEPKLYFDVEHENISRYCFELKISSFWALTFNSFLS